MSTSNAEITGAEHSVSVARGRLALKSVALAAPEGARVSEASASVAGADVPCNFEQEGSRVAVTLGRGTAVGSGKELAVKLAW